MTSPPSPLVSRWAGDAAWLGMDASARGFHTQLLLIAAQRHPVGTLPDDDAQWRRWLGLPEADEGAGEQEPDGAAVGLMGQSLRKGREMGVPDSLVLALHPQARHWRSHQGQWLDHLWMTRWKPMLCEAWTVIDAATVAAYPHLKGQVGQRFCSMAVALGELTSLPVGQAAIEALAHPVARGHVTEQTPKPKRATRPRKPKEMADPLLAQLLSLAPDTGPLQNNVHVLKCFRAVPLPEQRQTLWDLGVRVLSISPDDAKGARSFLSGLIRQHGEQAVAKAVGDVAVKAIAPADAKAYLVGVLRQDAAGGNVKVQEALERRGRVAL